ncbi:MAG: T9SS type A sorting domain-containing protein [Hymenobacter sp.]|nr:T9SS type A sorting domain-containing protein [Hymenobacter sp.]
MLLNRLRNYICYSLSSGLGALFFLWVVLAPASARAQTAPLRLEAEQAGMRGSLAVSTAPAGYSGAGYAATFQAADSLVFSFQGQAGPYTLRVRYTAPAGPKTAVLVVNGAESVVTFAGTTATFASLVVGRYQLAAGQNTILVKAGQGNFGIDYLDLLPTTTVVPLVNGRAEAEAADLTGVTTATSPTGFSGTGFVTGFTNSDALNVSITFNNATAGLYKLTIGYTSPFGLKGYNVTVNAEGGSGFFNGTTPGADFSSAEAGSFLLPQGLNTVVIGGNYGYYGIDYIQVTPTTVALPVKPPKQLSDAQATSGTRSLFSYITDLYGTKVLSGQQDDQMGRTGSEVSYVLAQTGKEPAIVSMDLFDYTTSPVAQYGQPNGTTERYIDWATRGNGRGIVSLIWHWRAPTDLVNPTDPSGAFYTVNTTFDLAAVLADKTGSRYQLLLQDIDLVAVQLRKFDALGIPVLWRPLHESPGTFFWWGAKGPAAFKELWQLVYTRLTTVHQLHNLIWVYSTTDNPLAAWYPGDAYVDITGEDIYATPANNMSGNWATMQTLFSPRKLVALTESGTLTDPDRIRGYATWWSWFCGWQGSYIRTQPTPFLQRIYNDADIITRDELPNWYDYVVAATRGSLTRDALTVYPNPASGYSLNVKLQLPGKQRVDVALTNTVGQRVARLTLDLPGGANEFQVPITNLSPGIYQLLVQAPHQPVISKRVLITR